MSPTEAETSSAVSLGYGSEESLSDLESRDEHPQRKCVFVNKDINLQKIKYYGFDMDYTVCEYISPEFDVLAFNLAKQFMVDSLNYPREILDLEYNPKFPRRGLWYDRQLGNLLKVDQFGKILICCHGFNFLKGDQLSNLYPHKIQRMESGRIYVMNTLFNLAETHLIASLTHYMNNRDDAEAVTGGWNLKNKNEMVTYRQLFEDLREAIENLHEEKILKISTINNLEKYVTRDSRLPNMLRRIRESGRKTFLLTNSDWWYTSHIMRHVLGDGTEDDSAWLQYFDLCCVDACKPKFFKTENILHYVNTKTGEKSEVEKTTSAPVPTVYSGGDHVTLTKLLGAAGPDVLYCGDHLYADVVKCRKHCHWRTLLIVPELLSEVSVSHENRGVLNDLTELESRLFREEADDLCKLKEEIWSNIKKLDNSFGITGSIFRAGTKLSYFGSQVLVWSDLYTGSVNNLHGYELTTRFRGPVVRLPHEHHE